MIEEKQYGDYLDALLAGRRPECHDVVRQLLDDGIEIKALYSGLFQRSLYRVGELWEQNIITVANEHLATSITERLLNLVYPQLFAVERTGRKALISCSANEFHYLGGKMVADILELNGWDGYFLGANSPPEVLVRHIHEFKPEFVGLSLSISSNMTHLQGCIEAIRHDFPHLDILIGGQAFRWEGLPLIRQYPATEYMATLDQLESSIQNA